MVDGIAGIERHRLGVVTEAKVEYVEREVLEQLVADLTVEDVRRARAEFPDGDPMRGFASVFYAATRTGAANGDDLSAFLSRVRLRDLGPILDKSAATLSDAPS